MKFTPLDIAGVVLIEPEPIGDSRGFFARTYCAREFAENGLGTDWVQMNMSFNSEAGTLRGLHFQRPPKAEAKVVGCMAGAIQDVVVDLRRGSPTFGQSASVRLDARNNRMLHIPPGVAHGFQTLEDDTALRYMHSEFYSPGHEGGLHHADPELGISWPRPVTSISDRDTKFPRLHDLEPVDL